MNKLEKEIQKEIIQECKRHDKIAWIDRANSGKVKVKGGWMQLHQIGTPDLIGFTWEGQFIGIEMKRPDTMNNLKPEQLSMQSRMRSANCIFGVAYDLESLNLILDKI